MRIDSNTLESWNNSELINQRIIPLINLSKVGKYSGYTISSICAQMGIQKCYISFDKFGTQGWDAYNTSNSWWFPVWGEIIEVPLDGSAWNQNVAR